MCVHDVDFAQNTAKNRTKRRADANGRTKTLRICVLVMHHNAGKAGEELARNLQGTCKERIHDVRY